MSEASAGKRHLAIFRAGPKSLHPQAVQRLAEQNFDYALSWYGKEDPAPEMADGAVFVHHTPGEPKWPGLYACLTECWDAIARYDYVWLPDDDLATSPEDVSNLFFTCAELKLDLAQPALTRNSYFTHAITLQHPAFHLRFTNFVEIMAPVLSRGMLERVLPTLDGTMSGWGLDWVWPHLSGLGKVAIVDAAAVHHTRPVMGGNGYAAHAEKGLHPGTELMWTMADFGLMGDRRMSVNFAGVLRSGELLVQGEFAQGEPDLMLPHLIDVLANAPMMQGRAANDYLEAHLDYTHSRNRDMVREALSQLLTGRR